MGSTAVMNVMLGWLKSLASWVLGLFNLAGSTGFSPLKWLSEHWLTLLIVLLAAGVVIDLVVWLLRWRPHWIWFNKKRIVIDDDDFFVGEDLVDAGLYDPSLFTGGVRRRSVDVIPGRGAPSRSQRTRDVRSRTIVPNRRKETEADPVFQVRPEPNRGEDEVFNVSDLPVSRDELAFRRKQKTKR